MPAAIRTVFELDARNHMKELARMNAVTEASIKETARNSVSAAQPMFSSLAMGWQKVGAVQKLEIDKMIANLKDFNLERAKALTGSEVTLGSTKTRQLEEIRARIDESRARRGALTGSEVTLGSPMSGKLAALRAALAAGGAGAGAARKEIHEMFAGRGLEPVGMAAGGGFLKGFFGKIRSGLGSTGTGFSQMIHVARASFDSLASGMSPGRILLQQGPQLAQALSLMGRGAIAVALRGVIMLLPALIAGAWFVAREHLIAKIFSGTNLPALAPPDVSRWKVQEKIFHDIARAAKEAARAYNSVSEAFNRYQDILGASHAQEKSLLDLERERDVNRIRARGGSPRQILRVEYEYRQRAIALEKGQMREELDLLAARERALVISAAAKEREAKAIRINNSESENANREELDRQAKAARISLYGEIDPATGTPKGGLMELHSRLKGEKPSDDSSIIGTLKQLGFMTKTALTMSPAEHRGAIAAVQGQIDSALSIIRGEQDFRKRKNQRETVREFRDRLLSEAAAEAAEAAKLGLSQPDIARKHEQRIKDATALMYAQYRTSGLGPADPELAAKWKADVAFMKSDIANELKARFKQGNMTPQEYIQFETERGDPFNLIEKVIRFMQSDPKASYEAMMESRRRNGPLEFLGASNLQGFALNAQQRIGAYAATPPDWPVLINAVRGILTNTGYLKPNTFQPVATPGAQYGPRTPAR